MTHDEAAISAVRTHAPQSGRSDALHPQPDPSRRAFLGTLARVAGIAALLPVVSRRASASPSAASPSAALPSAALPSAALPSAASPSAASPSAASPTGGAVTSLAAGTVVVYKDPSCGCCNEWVKHMQKSGFTVTAHDTPDMDAQKKRLGVPPSLASCHTAVVDDYLLEGHVPADLVQRMLKEKPVARGLAVPGMPMGSPGMEGPTKDKYDVMLFDRLGKSKVYASR